MIRNFSTFRFGWLPDHRFGDEVRLWESNEGTCFYFPSWGERLWGWKQGLQPLFFLHEVRGDGSRKKAPAFIFSSSLIRSCGGGEVFNKNVSNVFLTIGNWQIDTSSIRLIYFHVRSRGRLEIPRFQIEYITVSTNFLKLFDLSIWLTSGPPVQCWGEAMGVEWRHLLLFSFMRWKALGVETRAPAVIFPSWGERWWESKESSSLYFLFIIDPELRGWGGF